MNSKIETAFLNIYTEAIKNPAITLDGHLKNEIGVTNDYRGRAIYEFFQNAIDRAKSKIWIHLNKSQRTLTVANDGVEFSIEKGDRNYSDLESLCSINTSSKNQNESIGNKGVGFKSCWEYTKKVSVCSIIEDSYWGFELHNPLTIDKIISPIGKELIETWKSNNDYSIVLKNNKNRIPSFYFPLPIDNADIYFESYKEAITVIKFHDLTDEKLGVLENKIKEFSEHQVFFIQQLESLKDSKVQIELKVDDNVIITLDTQHKPDEWLIESKVFRDEDLIELQNLSSELNYKIEHPKIAIAFPLLQSMDENENIHSNFYCYLPTEVKCGFNVLIHGDFLLDASRKQIDFENNPYNKKLLTHIAKLFVDSLLEKKELHNLPYFGKFLFPLNKDGKIEAVFKELLFGSSNLNSILSKVYITDRKWKLDSYSLIFDVIDRWIRDRYSKENVDYYYERVYNETIRHFCDPKVFIVPIIEGETIIYMDNLPDKESEKRLFFRKKEDTTIENSILEELKNISITDFPSINREYYFRSAVKRYSTIEILRAINIDKEINTIEYFYPKILKFVFNLIQDSPPRTERQSFFTDTSLEYQLARIKLPCVNDIWKPAIQCYTGINLEISAHFTSDEFYELDLKACEDIIEKEKLIVDESTVFLKRFGIWVSTLPFQNRYKQVNLPFSHFPQLKNNHLKLLINRSIPDWHNITVRDELIKGIKSESWFYDEANKSFTSPSRVFLFNDARTRKCIAQEYKSDELKELYYTLDIKSIEDTEDINKIMTQLEIMKSLEVDEYHKTVYKQLVLRISRLNYVNVREIPLLTTEAKYKSEKCWFVPHDQRKYIHHFSDYNFVNFDAYTAIGFIKNLTHVEPFEPEFIIKPEVDKLEKDLEIKDYFEKEYLPDFFALAENFISTVVFDKQECINRWNNLEIFKTRDEEAPDVWLEVQFNNKSVKLYKDQRKEVLYKPVSKTIKESVGLLAYDLHDYKKNTNLSKFGVAIAEAVFRNQNFGEILSNYIQKKQFDPQNANEYLKERGIGDSELNQTRKFIEVKMINNNEWESFLQAINVNNNVLGIDNWTEKSFYSGFFFNELRSTVIEALKPQFENTSKFESLMELINPFEANLKFFIDQKRHLQICYYAHYNKELTNEKFDMIIKDEPVVEKLFSFDFHLNLCYSILGIPLIIDPVLLEIAEANLEIIVIQRKCGFPEKMELTPIISNGIKSQHISAVGKSDTYTIKRSYQQHEELSRSQHNRGIGVEKILSLQYAQQLIQAKQLEFVKEYIHRIGELKDLEIPDVINNIESLAEILQVSASKGDGLGYDILKPEIDEAGQLKYFNRVEIKSSKSDTKIYLSEAERLKILHFAGLEGDKKEEVTWKLFHYVDGNLLDRTKNVLDAIKAHAKTYNGDQLLAGDTWVINFVN